MNKRTHAGVAVLVLAAAALLGACAKEEPAAADRAAPAAAPPPAIGGTGPAASVGAGLLPHRDNGPVDPGEVGGMRSVQPGAAEAAKSPPKKP